MKSDAVLPATMSPSIFMESSKGRSHSGSIACEAFLRAIPPENGQSPLTSHMKTLGRTIDVPTSGKGTYEITDKIHQIVRESGIRTGTVTMFIRHTSASLIIFENADRTARTDLHEAFERLVPEDSGYFVHTAEGPDDSTSHIRSILTSASLVVPIEDARMQLGTWQGIFVFEHREAPHRRGIAVNVMGQ